VQPFGICYEVVLLLLRLSVLPIVEHCSHNSSFIIYFEETFMNTCQLHTPAAAWNSIITHFNCMLTSESTVVLPYIERNNCDKLNMILNV
jgi:hypothetical protein